LTPDEKKLKEKIWNSINREWLDERKAKRKKKEEEKKEMKEKGIMKGVGGKVLGKNSSKGKKKKKKKVAEVKQEALSAYESIRRSKMGERIN
jgi:hypothetical protein